MDFGMYKEAIATEVRSLYDFFNSDINIFNKHRGERPLEFYLCDVVNRNVKQPEINAYASYGDIEDKILVTKELFRLMHKLFTTIEKNPIRAAGMLQIATYFCITHEWAHLYAGHCQLSKTGKLHAVYDTDTGLSALDSHTLEWDADCTAACRTSEKMFGLMKDKSFIEEYGDKGVFIQNCFKSIHGFFFILRYLDKSTEQVFYSYTHPPSIARLIYSIDALCFHSKEVFKESFGIKQYAKSFKENDTLFCEALDVKMANKDYALILDGSILEYKKQLSDNWNRNIKKRLVGLNRIALAYK